MLRWLNRSFSECESYQILLCDPLTLTVYDRELLGNRKKIGGIYGFDKVNRVKIGGSGREQDQNKMIRHIHKTEVANHRDGLKPAG